MPTVTRSRKGKKGSKPTKGASTAKPVKYQDFSTEVCRGDKAITPDKAKELLGWEEEDEKTPFGNRFLLKHNGKKVRCTNNLENRPIYSGNLAKLRQEILRGHWVFNGEPIIIDKFGGILNGQHSLIAVVQAADEYEKNPDQWPAVKSVAIDKLIVYGIDGSDRVVNTMDTCKPRSLMDVIFRASYFGGMPSNAQRMVAKMTEHAIRMLWHRTGTHANAFAVRQTHSESIDFLECHIKLVEAVKYIYEENDTTNKIGKYISPGYAVAALYLMGVSSSDPKTYYGEDKPNEKVLDFKHWDKACEFFVCLANGGKELEAVRKAIGELIAQGSTTVTERWAVIVKAWPNFRDGKSVTAKTVSLEFEYLEEERHLAETPLLGGIDIGDEGLSFIANGDPTPEEIEEAKDKVRGNKKAHRKGEQWDKGDVAWVCTPREEPYLATLVSSPMQCQDGIERINVEDANGVWEVAVADLSLTKFGG